ncbi:hypothetical protein [Streptomyces sp. Je 1-369]|uniref:hypothetical protein n=1 Tax=Streptomyces sp. Je 1-369 TaxID=2966192 RepID=UPI0022863A60|nr:hypothetical protein [Streptomyces sp. Je 1-369]WAL96911.1 hypothetical protein NOO62_21925 [Streptomyces sp. Je 1-369]
MPTSQCLLLGIEVLSYWQRARARRHIADDGVVQEKRAEEYGKCAAVLDVDLKVPGAAAIFDQALTNGLAAIVAQTWPGEEAEKRKNGEHRLKSAAQLLQVITRRCDEAGEGIRLLPDEVGAPGTPVDTDTLRDALEQTQRVRHARGAGELEARHVTALLALDDHSALGQVSDERRESDWVRDEIQDRYEQQRSYDYMQLIGDDEADRRMSVVGDYGPVHPDDLIDDKRLMDCPVCQRETLVVTGLDDFGAGYGPGTCVVCSYARSIHAAHELALHHMIARQQGD